MFRVLRVRHFPRLFLHWNKYNGICHPFPLSQYQLRSLDVQGLLDRLSSISSYSSRLEESKLPVIFGTVTPFFIRGPNVHHEIGPYSNQPKFKRSVRHALTMIQSVETLVTTILHQTPGVTSQTLRTATLGLHAAREELLIGLGRYFLGGTAINMNLNEIEKQIRHALHIVSEVVHSLFADSYGVDLGLDDHEVDVRGSIFDHSLEMDSLTEQIVLFVFNPHSHTMNTVLRISVGFPAICAFSDSDQLIRQQVFTDTEQGIWLILPVEVSPLSSRVIILRHCKNNTEYRTRTMELRKEKNIVVEPVHGIVLNSQGEIDSFTDGNETLPFRSYVGQYHGSDVRACRTGQ